MTTDPTPEPCVFCRIVKNDAPATIVDEGGRWVAFKPLGPHLPGHVLFVSRVHVMHAAEFPIITAAIMAAASEYVRDTLRGPANILTSIGAAATQTVDHLHIHVIPRGPEDGLPRDWPWMRGMMPADFIERADKAVNDLTDLRASGREHVRLGGKIEGVKVMRSYIEDTLR